MNYLTPARNRVPARAGGGYPVSLIVSDPAPFALRHRRTPGDGMTVSVEGELDLGTRTALREALELATCSCAGEVSLALGECTFMDASTLAVITNQAAELDAQGRRLTIRGCSAPVARFIRVAGMNGLDPLAFFPASSPEGGTRTGSGPLAETSSPQDRREAERPLLAS